MYLVSYLFHAEKFILYERLEKESSENVSDKLRRKRNMNNIIYEGKKHDKLGTFYNIFLLLIAVLLFVFYL